jgi:predicted DNA-binding mobile mystery protein A
MRPEFKKLRIGQLQKTSEPFLSLRDSPRPRKGWLLAMREVSGLTVREIAKRLGKAPSLVVQLEKSEAEYRITLASLRDAADALGCQLVYAIVPKIGNVEDLAEARARAMATENVGRVEHSMALEDQAVGGVPAKIEEETKRILKKGR